MLILRVRQAEVALADGRLDEAYDLAVANDVGRHRCGQRLIGRLLAALVQRGNDHLRGERFGAALADGDKAAKMGGNSSDVVALRAAAMDRIGQVERAERRQARLLAAARVRVDEGQLDLGEQLLGDVSADVSRVGVLRTSIEHRRHSAADAVDAAQQALKRGDVSLAAQELARGRRDDPQHPSLTDLGRRICDALSDEVQAALESGMLDRAEDLLRRLRLADPDGPPTRQQQVITCLREAWQQMEDGSYSDARVTLGRVLPLLSGAAWLKKVAEQLAAAEDAITQLRTGPLPWLGDVKTDIKGSDPIMSAPRSWQPARQVNLQRLPSQILLHADGIGSFLLVFQPVVTIGPISSSAAPDIALVAEATVPPITIERLDDDYFLRTARRAAGPSSAGRLLASGEQLQLSPRCRLTFALPSAASTSAVLDLTGARLPRADVRRVILMDRDLIVAASTGAHISAAGLDQPVLLHVRDGQLFSRASTAPLPLGEKITIGNFSFALAPLSTGIR